MGAKIDMTGWKMWEHGVPDSYWKVLTEDKNNKKPVHWICKCRCGVIKSVDGSNLRSGISKSCGCKPKIKIDMTGWRMSEHGAPGSKIIIIGLSNERTQTKENKILWKCKCDCGNELLAESDNLREGVTKSCGCLVTEILRKRNISHLENQIVGFQTNTILVLEDLGLKNQLSRNRQERWVKCRCLLCNKIFESSWNNIQSGNTKSCGCLMSKGEQIIKTILENNNINYLQQYSFDDLTGKNNCKLRFDFAIFTNDNNLIKLIEFDGRQHFTGPEGYWSHSDSLETIQKRDELKNQYCENHNILLQRIPYTDIHKINLNMLLTGIKQYYDE